MFDQKPINSLDLKHRSVAKRHALEAAQ